MRLNPGLVVLVVCVVLLAACGPPVSEVDPVQYCADEGYWLCRREEFAMRIDATEAVACYAAIEPTCAEASWPVGCAPTEAETEACLDLLGESTLVHFSNDELLAMYDDCQICP